MSKSGNRGVTSTIRIPACLLLLGLFAAACSSSSGPSAGKLRVNQTHVRSAQPHQAPAEAQTGQSVTPGQVLSTDATGLAQVTYPDGSLTRLDSDTTFKVVSLTSNSGGRQTLGSVTAGKVWNKVTKLSRSGSFEVEAGGTTAAVRGTSFAIECKSSDECTVISVIHTVVVTSSSTGQTAVLPPQFAVTATKGELTNRVELTAAQLAADQWIEENLRKDGDPVFTAPAPTPAPAPSVPTITPTTAALPFTPAAVPVDNCYPGCAPPNEAASSSVAPSTGTGGNLAGSGTSSPATSGSSSTVSGASAITGLPFTGADVVQLVLLALMLMGLGWLLTRRSRTRSSEEHPPHS